MYFKNYKMKAIKLSNLSAGIYVISALLCISIFLQSCASGHAFAISQVVPEAKGSVKVKRDNNNNYNIDLSVIHLADPKRLTPAKELYVVWMETETDGVKNIGELTTSSSMLSKTMKSSLSTVSTSRPTSFFITAEDKADLQSPSGVEVLRTSSF